jgi:hypothetical protein
MKLATHTLLIGIGATALLDLLALARQRLFGTPRPDWGLVGRWFAHMPRGQFRHDAIARAPAHPHELAIGWAMHYAIGVAYAALLLAITGPQWVSKPTLLPAMLVGLATVAAPFLLMQPGMGAGLAGRRTPDPWLTRRRALVTHTLFGLSLYAAAWASGLVLG